MAPGNHIRDLWGESPGTYSTPHASVSIKRPLINNVNMLAWTLAGLTLEGRVGPKNPMVPYPGFGTKWTADMPVKAYPFVHSGDWR